jgi:hypothetical protein
MKYSELPFTGSRNTPETGKVESVRSDAATMQWLIS